MFKSSVKNPKDQEWFTIQTINTALDSELSSFFGLEWKNSTDFFINNGVNFYSFNTVSGKGK